MKIGILGLGEVGSAIKKLVSKKHQVFVKDLDFDEIKSKKVHILHVCIPYTKKFIKSVTKTIKKTQPNLTIINSTVKPGTTQELHLLTKANLAHAPIMGVHPNLYEYLFKFTKFVGAVNKQSRTLAVKHFEDLGVKTKAFSSPTETELGKILSTTYYGWNILFQKWAHQLSSSSKAEFDQVYTQFNHNYNRGYGQELPHVVRPVLKHSPGEIGGHCVIPNATIIHDWLGDDFTKFLLDQNSLLGANSKKR